MAQNRKKGMAKRALSVSLVAAMLATSNTPAWASGFVNENEDGVQAFFNEISEEVANNTDADVVAADTAIVGAAADDGFDVSGIGSLTLADIKWFAADNETNSLKALAADAAGVVAVVGDYRATDVEVGFVKGDVDSNGQLDTSVGTTYTKWDGTVASAKANIGNKIAVVFRNEKLDDSQKKNEYYHAGSAVVANAKVDDVLSAELTINGKVYTADVDGNLTPKKIDVADSYEFTAAKLYLTEDKKVYTSLTSATDDVTLSVDTASYTSIGDTVTPEIEFKTNNAEGFDADTYATNGLETQGSSLDSKLVSFNTGSLTYDPVDLLAKDNLADVNAELKKLVNVDAKVGTDYSIKVYKNPQGTSAYTNNEVLPAGNVYLGVVVNKGDYKNQKAINPVATRINAKNIGEFVVDTDTLNKVEFDDSYDADAAIDDVAANLKYDATKEAVYDIAGDASLNVKVSGGIASGNAKAAPGEEIVVTVSSKDANYTGTKTIKYTLKVTETDMQAAADEFKAAMNDGMIYDAKSHVVNNLVTGDLDVLKRNDFKLTSKDTANGTIKDAGTYRITLEVISGPFKGVKIEDINFVIAKRDLKVFSNNEGVKANKVTFDPDWTATNFAEKVKAQLGLSLTYNGETLRPDVDYTYSVTSTDMNAGDAVEVTLAATASAASNYVASAPVTITVGKVQKRPLSEVELPELAVQNYSDVAWTVSNLQGLTANGETANYNTLIKVGAKKDISLVERTDYTATVKQPVDGIGKGVLTLKGENNYTGTVTKNFTVVNKEITADIGTLGAGGFKNVIDDQIYGYAKVKDSKSKGVELTFAANSATNGLIVRDKNTGRNVADNCDFVYTSNQEVGTATVEAKGKTGYNIYAAATFKILPMQVTDKASVADAIASVTFDTIKDKDYTGEAITPEVKLLADGAALADDDYTLKEGVDYKVEYKDNINAANDKATITVTGLGNYVFNATNKEDNKTNTGITKTFDIKPVTIGKAHISVKDVVYAGGLEVTPNITILNPESGKAMVKDVDYTVVMKNGINAGAAVATITLKPYEGTACNFTWNTDVTPYDPADPKNGTNKVAADVTFQITKKALADCDVKIVNGKVVVKNGEITVPETEYTVTENEDRTFTVKAAEKNYTGEVTVSATSAPAATQAKVASKTTSSVKVAWDAVDGAEGYTIWYHSEKDTANTRKIITGGDITSWTHKGLAAGTKYFYTVKTWVKDAEGKYVFGEETSYVRGTTMPMKAKIAKVTANGGMVKVALADAAAGAEKYSMCYSLSSDFASFKVGVRTSYTTRTFTNALTKGTYYVRVKSYRDLNGGKRIYGAWSNTVKVVVK